MSPKRDFWLHLHPTQLRLMLSLCAAARSLGSLRNSRGTRKNSSGRGGERTDVQEGAVQEFRLSRGTVGTGKEISQGVKSGVRDGCRENASYIPAVLHSHGVQSEMEIHSGGNNKEWPLYL